MEVYENINFEIEGLNITFGDVINFDEILELVNKVQSQLEIITKNIKENISRFVKDQKVKIRQGLENLSSSMLNVLSDKSRFLGEQFENLYLNIKELIDIINNNINNEIDRLEFNGTILPYDISETNLYKLMKNGYDIKLAFQTVYNSIKQENYSNLTGNNYLNDFSKAELLSILNNDIKTNFKKIMKQLQ